MPRDGNNIQLTGDNGQTIDLNAQNARFHADEVITNTLATTTVHPSDPDDPMITFVDRDLLGAPEVGIDTSDATVYANDFQEWPEPTAAAARVSPRRIVSPRSMHWEQ